MSQTLQTIRTFRWPLAALGALAVCFGALAQADKGKYPPGSCPANDRMMPERTTMCRNNVIVVCEKGEWVEREGTRCTPPKR